MNRSQLTQETSTQKNGNTFRFGYDGTAASPGGPSGGPGNATTYEGYPSTFNSDNELTGSGYGYDGNGNPTSYKGQTLTFDPEQRMTGYNGSTQADAYSGDGLRSWKQAYAYSNRIYSLLDGEQPVLEYYSNGSGSLTALALNTFGADGLVSRRTLTAGSTSFYTFDERGNVAQRTSSSGAVSNHDLYDAYGGRTSTTSGRDVFEFGGQWGYYSEAAETGLILCTHRFYDPSNGRWLTRDPMGYSGGINLYGYVGNDPGNRWDPLGYDPILAGVGAAAGGGGLIGTGAIVEGAGLGLDATVLGAPVGVVLNVAGGVLIVGGLLVAGGAAFSGDNAPTEVRDGKGLRPDPNATGDHCTWRTGESGKIDHGAAWERNTNPQQPAPWNPGGRYDRVGPAHTNRDGTVVPPPHTQDPSGEATPYP